MNILSKIKAIAISLLGIGILCVPCFNNEINTVFAEYVNDDFLSSYNGLMDVNNGTISILYSGGIVGENNGSISEVDGTVNTNGKDGIIGELQGSCLVNNGKITLCSRGSVGTNSGTIETINSSGFCKVNDDDCKINLNAGTVEINYGVVGENYGEIKDFRSGSVAENKANATVTFTNSAIKGIVRKNYGDVIFNNCNSQIEITNNYSTVTIDGGKVQVINNYGTIIVKGKTSLYVADNYGTIEKTGEPTFYDCDCINNYGTISFNVNSNGTTFSARNNYESIKFVGDDGKATITSCAATVNGINYASHMAYLKFTLPDGYYCDDEYATRDVDNPNLWTIQTRTYVDETEYEVICHKCHSEELKKDGICHWFECDECGNAFSKGEHTGEFISNNDLTCSVDETKTRICSICGNEETITVLDSHLDSNKHNPVTDAKVEPTYVNTGLTEGSHCADCGKILVEQNEIPTLLDGCVHIVFSGLEQIPTVTSENITCDLGIFIKNNSSVSFTLDKNYACTNIGATSDNNNIWTAQVIDNDYDGVFVIECHKCAFSSEHFDDTKHWTECIFCGRKNNDSLTNHVFTDFVSNNDALCVSDGTKTRECTMCQYSETITDVGSSKLVEHSNLVIDSRVEPTYENTGLTEGSHCLCCGLVVVAQQPIPKLEKEPEENSETLGIVLSLAIGIPVSAGIVCGFFFFKRHKLVTAKGK